MDATTPEISNLMESLEIQSKTVNIDVSKLGNFTDTTSIKIELEGLDLIPLLNELIDIISEFLKKRNFWPIEIIYLANNTALIKICTKTYYLTSKFWYRLETQPLAHRECDNELYAFSNHRSIFNTMTFKKLFDALISIYDKGKISVNYRFSKRDSFNVPVCYNYEAFLIQYYLVIGNMLKLYGIDKLFNNANLAKLFIKIIKIVSMSTVDDLEDAFKTKNYYQIYLNLYNTPNYIEILKAIEEFGCS